MDNELVKSADVTKHVLVSNGLLLLPFIMLHTTFL